MNEKETLHALLDKTASELAEHFDSVRIFCTKQGDGSASDSTGFDTGRGNLYAQLGQVQEWMCIQTEYHRCEAERRYKQGEGE